MMKTADPRPGTSLRVRGRGGITTAGTKTKSSFVNTTPRTHGHTQLSLSLSFLDVPGDKGTV